MRATARTSDAFWPNHADGSIPPLRAQPVALVFRQFESLDRMLDRRLLVGPVLDDAHEPRRHPAESMIPVAAFGPRMVCTSCGIVSANAAELARAGR
jgi:hypothetical protein